MGSPHLRLDDLTNFYVLYSVCTTSRILCVQQQQAKFHHMINSMGLISVESANTSTTDMTSALFNAHLFQFPLPQNQYGVKSRPGILATQVSHQTGSGALGVCNFKVYAVSIFFAVYSKSNKQQPTRRMTTMASGAPDLVMRRFRGQFAIGRFLLRLTHGPDLAP